MNCPEPYTSSICLSCSSIPYETTEKIYIGERKNNNQNNWIYKLRDAVISGNGLKRKAVLKCKYLLWKPNGTCIELNVYWLCLLKLWIAETVSVFRKRNGWNSARKMKFGEISYTQYKFGGEKKDLNTMKMV